MATGLASPERSQPHYVQSLRSLRAQAPATGRRTSVIESNMPDIEDFRRRVSAFLGSHGLPPRVAHGSDVTNASLFKSREEEIEEIPRAKEWRAVKYDAGFGWITGPTEYGGTGLPNEFEVVFDEMEGQYEVPNESCFAPGLEFVGPVIEQYGNDRLRASTLPKLYRGDSIACQLFSEPGAGSDLASLRTRAVPSDGWWTVSGQKLWTSRAHYSDIGLLLARTGSEEDRHHAITAFVVDMHASGVTVRPLRQMTGDAPFNEVFLDGVVLPDGNRLGDVNQGWGVAMSTLSRERSAIARSERYRPGGLADIASPMKIAQLIDQCGRSTDPVTRQRWSDLYARSTAMRLTGERLHQAEMEDGAAGVAGGIGKVLLARNMSMAADLIGDLLGARTTADTGESWATKWLPFLLGVPGLHIGGGTDQVILNSIAERALGLPRSK